MKIDPDGPRRLHCGIAAMCVASALVCFPPAMAETPPPASPKPMGLDSVPMTKSPVIMRGIFGSREPEIRGSGRALYGHGGLRTENAVMCALRWLKSVQNEDGSWGDAANPSDVSTALAVLCFLGHGETPTSEEFGKCVENGFYRLVDFAKDKMSCPSDEPAYGHAFVTWALCEAHALTKVPMLKQDGENSLKTVIESQRESGLWDVQYRRGAAGVDSIEASFWQVMALNSARLMGSRRQGLKESLSSAVQGMETVLSTSEDLPSTAMAVLCLQLTGRGNSQSCLWGINRLMKESPDWISPTVTAPVIHWYVVGKTRFLYGGQCWSSWHKISAPMLVANQTTEGTDRKSAVGYWDSPGKGERFGRIYSTALCTMMLQVYYAYFPKTRMPLGPVPESEADDVDIEINIL
jgi:hypothetical protein